MLSNSGHHVFAQDEAQLQGSGNRLITAPVPVIKWNSTLSSQSMYVEYLLTMRELMERNVWSCSLMMLIQWSGTLSLLSYVPTCFSPTPALSILLFLTLFHSHLYLLLSPIHGILFFTHLPPCCMYLFGPCHTSLCVTVLHKIERESYTFSHSLTLCNVQTF